jgi:hypothetical protein
MFPADYYRAYSHKNKLSPSMVMNQLEEARAIKHGGKTDQSKASSREKIVRVGSLPAQNDSPKGPGCAQSNYLGLD